MKNNKQCNKDRAPSVKPKEKSIRTAGTKRSSAHKVTKANSVKVTKKKSNCKKQRQQMVAQSTTAYARKDVDSDSEYKFDNTVLSQSNYYYAQLVKQIKVKSVSQYERN